MSQGPWAGLNLAFGGGDSDHAVTTNRARLAASVEAPLIGMRQVHGNTVAPVNDLSDDAPEADGLVTGEANLALTVLIADCVPVLLAEPHARVVAAVHAGRRGIELDIISAAIAEMRASGADPDRVQAVIGPAICGSCYEVPVQMRAEISRSMPHIASTTSWGTPALDLPEAAATQLRASGVHRVQNVGVCTFEDADMFSYRRSHPTGRSAGVIRLKR